MTDDRSAPVTPAGATGAGRRAALPYALLVGCVFLVYANALPARFVIDDLFFLRDLNRLRTLAELIPYFTTPISLSSVVAPVETRVYRPVAFLWKALIYRLSGKRPWVVHATNVLLHALAACLVLIALRRLFALTPGAALLAALLWAVHPVNVEAVTFATGVEYLLMGIFLLLAVLVTCGWWPPTSTRPAQALAAAGAFTVSVLTHELGLMAPALAALALAVSPGVGWASGRPPGRGALVSLGAMGAAAILYGVGRATLIGTGQAGRLEGMMGHLGSRLLQAPEIVLRYLGLLAVPARLTIDRSQDIPVPSGALDPHLLSVWGLFAFLVWGVARLARRVPVAAFGGAWFLLAYLPISNTLIPLYSVMAERYLYVASVGIVAGVVATARAAAAAWRISRVATLAAILLVATYAARSVARNLDWRDDHSLFRASVAASPRSAYLHYQLGWTYYQRGMIDLAEQELQTALELNPSYAEVHANAGYIALDRGRLDEAEAHFRRAISLRPDLVAAYVNLAVVAERRGQDAEKIRWLVRAETLLPANAEIQLNLGKAYLTVDPVRAAQHLRRFLDLAPDHPHASAIRTRLLTLPPTPPR